MSTHNIGFYEDFVWVEALRPNNFSVMSGRSHRVLPVLFGR